MKNRVLLGKLIFCLVATLGIILLVTGCEAEKSVTDFMVQAKQVLDQRVGANKDLLEKLKKSGFIGDELYKGINDALTKQAEHFNSLSEDSKALDEIASATVKYWNKNSISGAKVYLKDGGNLAEARWITDPSGIREYGGSSANVSWSNSIVSSNYIISGGEGTLKSEIANGYNAYIEQELGLTPNTTPKNNAGFAPIQLVNTSHMKEFNQLLNYKVYVLQSADDLKIAARGNDNIILAKDNTVSSDTIKLAVEEAKKQADAGNKSQAKELLNRYFKEAKDSNNNAVRFYQYNNIGDCPITVSKNDPNGNSVTNKPGTDLIISQTLECYDEDGESLGPITEDVFQLRLIEFNEEVVNKIVGGVQGNGQRYIVLDDAVYIVEYPVEVIDTIEVSGTNSYSIKTTPSEFTLNLLTGEMTNLNGQVIVQQGTNFLHTGDSTDPTLSGTGAFCVGKEGTIIVDRGRNSAGTSDTLTMQGGTILLRDYLELTYMPGVHSSETMVALGRKIRVLNLEGTSGMDFGAFVGTDGEPIEGVPKISIDDIVDVKKLDTQQLYKLDLSGSVTSSGIDQMFIDLATYNINYNLVKTQFDEAMKNNQVSNVITLSTQLTSLANSKSVQESRVDSAIKTANNQKELIEMAEKERDTYNSMSDADKNGYASQLNISKTVCDELIKIKADKIKTISGSNPTDLSSGSNDTLANQAGNGIGANNTVNSTTGNSSIESLTVNRTNSIEPVTKFGGDIIDRYDSVDSLMPTHPIFYCIATDFNPIQSNLLNGWVNVDSNEKNSLKWWLSFLQTNRFDYSITTDDLSKFLGGNYALALGDNDYIVIDLKTIAKIQLEMDEANEFNVITFARTLFIIVGYCCIAYAMLVMACWAVDTNLDVGISTLRIITFGHWIAIKYADELPDVGADGKRYMTFSKMLTRMLVLVTVGILLTFVDIIGIVTAFLKIFGGLATAAYEMVFGKK